MTQANNSILQALKTAFTVEDVVNKHIGKVGLDTESGRFRVKGILTTGKIFKRKHVGTNIVVSAGYVIEDLATGDTLCVSKEQGLKLCSTYGMKNAFISYREKESRNTEGECMQKKTSMYLQPFPQKTESFSQDDRVRTAFKLDEEGSLIRPFILNITEAECTEEMWRIIATQYKKGAHLSKRTNRGRQEQHFEKLENIRQALRMHGLNNLDK